MSAFNYQPLAALINMKAENNYIIRQHLIFTGPMNDDQMVMRGKKESNLTMAFVMWLLLAA